MIKKSQNKGVLLAPLSLRLLLTRNLCADEGNKAVIYRSGGLTKLYSRITGVSSIQGEKEIRR
jgi:hypothetical protein